MKIEHLLVSLLYSHDCVVIPGFGGLLTRDYPAHIHHATHMFVPPSRRVSFNQRLVQNDGVLAHEYARKTGTTYNLALQQIEALAQQWLLTIRAGEQLNLPEIGRFYLNQEGSLQFKPVVDANFSQDAFGLGVFRLSPVADRNILQHMNRQQIAVAKPLYRSRRLAWMRTAAILLPVAGLLYLGIQKRDFSEQALRNGAGFFFKVAEPVEVVLPEPLPGMEAAAFELAAKADALDAPEVLDDGLSEVVVAESVVVETPVASPSALSEFAFQIVVGSFSTQENAEKMTHSMPGAFVLPGNGKLIKVSAGGFATREEAEAFLQSNRSEFPRGAWIFRQ
jgi:hypothetical protein